MRGVCAAWEQSARKLTVFLPDLKARTRYKSSFSRLKIVFALLINFSTQTLPGLPISTTDMGENAKKSWDWHNTVIGEGYQAKGVVRQRVSVEAAPKIVDMRSTPLTLPSAKEESRERKESDKKMKKDRKSKKSSRRRSDSDSSSSSEGLQSKRGRFNPLLQHLSMRLRDNTAGSSR